MDAARLHRRMFRFLIQGTNLSQPEARNVFVCSPVNSDASIRYSLPEIGAV
jgi:hypothetical protein